MVDPEAIHPPAAMPVERERVGLGEDLGILHVQGDEIVDIEEPAVVDLPRRPPPVHQAIDLRVEQPGSRSGPGGPGRGSSAAASTSRATSGTWAAAPQPVEARRRRSRRRATRRRAPGGAAGQPPQAVDDLGQRAAGGWSAPQPPPGSPPAPVKHRWQRRRVQGEIVVEVADARHPRGPTRAISPRWIAWYGDRRAPGASTRLCSSGSDARHAMSNQRA